MFTSKAIAMAFFISKEINSWGALPQVPSVGSGTSRSPTCRTPELWWVATAFLKGKPIFSLKLEKCVFPALSSLISFFSEKNEAGLLIVAAFLPSQSMWKRQAALPNCSVMGFICVFSSLWSFKCHVSITGAVFSILSLTSLIAACLSIQLYFVNI